jgi:hypothetical protein
VDFKLQKEEVMDNVSVDERPQSYYGEEAEQWTCIFPGKMGISWKLAWNRHGTKSEAETQAAKNRNVVAVPLALWLRYKEYEHRSVVAERKLQEELGIRVDYIDEKPVFVQVRKKPVTTQKITVTDSNGNLLASLSLSNGIVCASIGYDINVKIEDTDRTEELHEEKEEK